MRTEVLTKSFIAGEDIPAHRFVKLNANGEAVQAGAGEFAIGVTSEVKATAGRPTDVYVYGLPLVEHGGTVNPGDEVASDADGKAVAAVADDSIVGRGVEEGAADEQVAILLTYEGEKPA